MRALVSHAAGPLRGTARVPGDKSISHRALMIGAAAVGRTRVRGLLEGADVAATAAALRALGVRIEPGDDGGWHVHGVGAGGLGEPASVLDLGNSGTSARLLMGLLASHPFTSHLTGDASLVRRPMARVAAPLALMGARVVAREGCRLPLAIVGTAEPVPIAYRLPVPSAQVKSALLLAALNVPGETTVIEDRPTRDHSERMLAYFGAAVTVERDGNGARAVALCGQSELGARDIEVPADPSSAAYPLVAALLCPGSEIVLTGVCVNPTRFGLVESLREMGAEIVCENARETAGEPVADLRVHAGALRGVEVPAERAPSMIDEYPVLAIAAACAQGTTALRGLAELRLKESDRLDAVACGLAACGAAVEVEGDDLLIHGRGRPPPGGARIEARLDHRIAMAFLTLGLLTPEPVAIDDGAAIATSFPGFAECLNGLGGTIAADPAAP